MSAPEFETQRRKELFEELVARAEVWLPEWQPGSKPGSQAERLPQRESPDVARALFGIAARLSAEVTQRLTRIPEKTFRGFIDWLGVRGDAARAARVPVVFVTTPVSEPVPAGAGVQLQASEVDPPVTLETENPLRIIPGTLASLIAAEPESDRFSLPPPGLLALEPPPVQPDEWTVRSAGAGGDAQLDPPIGLSAGVIVKDENGIQHRITAFENGIATLDPPLAIVSTTSRSNAEPAASQTVSQPRVTRVTVFAGFDPSQYPRQEHALYIGAEEGLDVKTAAVIEVQSDGVMPADLTWSYWGKEAGSAVAAASRWEPIATYWLGSRLLLLKPAGASDKKEISGQNRYWLRALRGSGFTQGTRLAQIRLLINCYDKKLDDTLKNSVDPKHKTFAAALATATPECEGVANTAPLVLNVPFYPLGREPRQFDSFYLGCKEAFSKPDAKVTLDFKINDQFSNALAAVQGGEADTYLLFGVGMDGKLRRIALKVAPATSDLNVSFLGSTQPTGSNGRPASLETGVRPGAALSGDAAKVLAIESVSDLEKRVWLYTGAKEGAGDWKSFAPLPTRAAEQGKPEDPPPQPRPVQTLLVQGAKGLACYLVHSSWRYPSDEVRGGRLHRGELSVPAAKADEQWVAEKVGGKDEGSAVDVETVAPVTRPAAKTGTFFDSDGLVAVSSSGGLFFREGAEGEWKDVNLPDQAKPIDPTVYPVAIRTKDGKFVVIARIGDVVPPRVPKPWEIAAIAIPTPLGDKPAMAVGFSADEIGGRVAGTAISLSAGAVDEAGPFELYFFVENKNVLKLAWAEVGRDSGNGNITLTKVGRSEVTHKPLPDAVRAETSFAPLAIGSTVLLPGEKGGVYVEKRSLPPSITVRAANAYAAVIVDQSVEMGARQFFDLAPKLPDDKLLVTVDETVPLSKSKALLAKGRAGKWETVDVYSGGDLFSGKRPDGTDLNKLQLSDEDVTTRKGDVLYIVQGTTPTATHKRIRTITDVPDPDPGAPPTQRVAVLDGSLVKTTTELKYTSVKKIKKEAELLPALDVSDPALSGAKLYAGSFSVAGATPAQQHASSEMITDRLVVLNDPWVQAPAPGTVEFTFSSSTVTASWTPINPATPNNPALSWEYWDGSSWWQIDKVEDETANLVKSGKVVFCVPPNLKPTDVVGRTNHWIRARLVGGDYGREVVKLLTSPATTGPANSTTQTVERITDDIRAPYVVSLEVRYSVCCPLTPEAVIAEDNGGMLDQSDANRTPGAAIEAFLPLAEALARLAAPGSAASPAAKAPAPVECQDCATGAEWRANASAGGAATGTVVGDSGGKAIYLGFDSALSGGPINLLFLVAERDHDDAFPLRVEVLRRNGFEAVTAAQDGTRGLNESGIVSFTLPEPPARAKLFGKSLFWLRLRARDGFSGAWLPAIRGAWLNASWATAAETQSIEVLGSSDGSPDQSVFLARRPVIKDSLDLRVRERLDAEEIDELLRADPDCVLDELGGRQGPWVRWREVAETDAESAGARVHMLDDGTGEITFGDGLHGRIPPAGRDAILARSYRRGGGVAANGIAAWDQVNLITPLQGVSGVLVPDGAAGGSDPQDPATVLRNSPFDIFSRDRVLTLGDIEARALDFSPDVAQARALSAGAGVQLVVVMRGLDRAPPQAVQRELARYLARRASPAWSARGALTIVSPVPVGLRVKLALAIDDIAFSGAVAATAEKRIAALLDPANGGLEGAVAAAAQKRTAALLDPASAWRSGAGWPLSVLPTQADIAAVLVDIPHLEELRDVRFYRVAEPGGGSVDLPPRLGAREMIDLVADGVRCEFSLVDSELIR